MNAIRDFIWWVLLGTAGLVCIASLVLGFTAVVNGDGGTFVLAVVILGIDWLALKMIEPGRGIW